MARSEAEIRDILKDDPGNEAFVDLAAMLTHAGRDLEAVEACLAGLSANPACHVGRLMLSRLLYKKGFYPFAIRELMVLSETLPQNEALQRLLKRISAGGTSAVSSASEGERTVAEAEFEIDSITKLDEEKH